MYVIEEPWCNLDSLAVGSFNAVFNLHHISRFPFQNYTTKNRRDFMAFALQFSSCTRRKCTLIDANKTRQFERRWMNNKSVFREIVEKIDRFYDQPRRFDYPRENECLLTRVYCKCLLISCTLIWSCHFVRKRHKSGFSSIFLSRMRAMKKNYISGKVIL